MEGHADPDDISEPSEDADSITSFDSYDNDNMVDYKNVKDLMEVKAPGSTAPTTRPTTIRLLHFKKTLVSALVKCPLNASNKGHTYIIETLKEHQARNDDPNAQLPLVPVQPTKPTAKADRATLSFYNQSVTEYNAHIEYNAQVLAVIQSTFPGLLDGLMIDGDLPDITTGRSALKHAFQTVLDSIVSRTSYIDLSKAIYSRAYEPSNTGPVSYFAECDNDNLLIIRMGHAPHSQALIMECALAAFAIAHTSSIVTFRTYESEWNTLKSQLTSKDNTYERFKTFFNTKLKNLFTDRLKTAHQANHADVLMQRVAALEHNIADFSTQEERLDELESHAYLSSRVAPPGSFCLPREDATAATSTDSTLASNAASNATFKAMLAEQATQHRTEQRALEARIEHLVANTSKGNKQPDKPRKFRQFKFYCSSHGCNSSHDSKDCRRRRADHKDAATISNTMGGNTRNVKHHMMWQDPDNWQSFCQVCPPGRG